MKKAPAPTAVHSLHRYFVNANYMRTLFDEYIERTKLPPEFGSLDWLNMNVLMGQWYGNLYVVIEGWKELQLADSVINKLLKSPNVPLLKRYRHGVFHFQKKYFDRRFMGLIEANEVPKWIRTLNREFGRFFLEYLKTKTTEELRPPELRAVGVGSSSDE
jgi:hypothetical protein